MDDEYDFSGYSFDASPASYYGYYDSEPTGFTEADLRSIYGDSNYIDDISAALQYVPDERTQDLGGGAGFLPDDEAGALAQELMQPGAREGIFNAARDSQEANRLIEARAPGFEQFKGNALAGYQMPGATPRTVTVDGKRLGTSSGTSQGGNLLSTLLPLLLLAMANRQGGTAGSTAKIPELTATQKQTPYGEIQRSAGYRPGQGGIRYFEPTQYSQRLARGGIADVAGHMIAMRQGGRLLDGAGDGVSDSIPATIDGQQPARLARGEYVIDARTVAELGNGSTDAGAERLDEMRERIHAKRRNAKVGQDSGAHKELLA